MAIGFALGGATKGLESAERAMANNRQLDLQQQSIMGDQKLRQRALDIQEKQMRQSQGNSLIGKAEGALADTLKLAKDTLDNTEGLSPEQRMAALEPLLDEAEELGGMIGRNVAPIRQAFMAQASVVPSPSMGDAPSGYRFKPDGSLEAIPGGPATKMAAGDAGRLAMLQTAKEGYDQKSNVLTKDWTPEERAQAAAGVGNIGRAQKQTSMLIESAVRAASGGTVREDEIALYESFFMPKLDDTMETRQFKIEKLKEYSDRAEAIALQGRGSPQEAEQLAQDVTSGDTPMSTGPQPMPSDKSQLKAGQVYDLPGGGQGLWNGSVFELL